MTTMIATESTRARAIRDALDIPTVPGLGALADQAVREGWTLVRAKAEAFPLVQAARQAADAKAAGMKKLAACKTDAALFEKCVGRLQEGGLTRAQAVGEASHRYPELRAGWVAWANLRDGRTGAAAQILGVDLRASGDPPPPAPKPVTTADGYERLVQEFMDKGKPRGEAYGLAAARSPKGHQAWLAKVNREHRQKKATRRR